MGLAIPFLWVFCCTYVKLRGLNSQSTFGFVNMSCLLPVCFSLACMFASHWPFSLEAFSSFQWSETTVDLFVSSFWAPVQNMPAPRNQSKDSACLDSVPFAGITVCATCCQVLKGERIVGLPSFSCLGDQEELVLLPCHGQKHMASWSLTSLGTWFLSNFTFFNWLV